MSLIDLLLNLAGLIFWHGWRGSSTDSPEGGALTLVSNLRPAEVQRPRRWIHLAALVALLVLRPVFYWHLGSTLNWTAAWSPGPVTLSFRSDLFARMFAFSLVSFGWMLFVWHAWLCLFAALSPRKDTNPVALGVREQLGWFARLPGPFLIVLPFVVLGLGWLGLVPLFAGMGLMPEPRTRQHLVQQAILVAGSLLLTFRWLLTGVFLLGLLNTYVYLGAHPVWELIQRTGRQLLMPLGWLRIGKIDIAPLAGIALAWWGAVLGEQWVRHLFQILPLPWP